MRVLCVLPCLPEDFCGECLNAILNQTLLPDLILVLPKKGEGLTLPERISWVLNEALSHVRLEDFDYIVRVDADTVLPPNYIEENLKDKPDLCGRAGYGLIVKVKPFLKLLNGRFHPKSDDSYIRYKFRMEGLKVTDWKVKPVVKRKSGTKHGLKYFLFRGLNMYRMGYEPLHVLGSFRWEPRNFLTVFGYLLALLRREGRFDVASFVWKQQINKLRRKTKMKVKVLQYCPKALDCVELTLTDVTETELTYKGKVVACSRQDTCQSMTDGGFCWINHVIETGKVGAEKVEQ